jgi:hypothetical protein
MKNDFILAPPPVVTPRRKLDNPQIDPKIIQRPPWPAKGDELNGREMSHGIYPNLKFLPIRRGRSIR